MMTPLYSADLAKFHSSLFLVCILGTILCSHQIEFHSNFNSSKINDIVIGEPISLPFIVSATS